MIELTEQEEKIAQLISKYANSLQPPTVARFAGGWVRDKLMGLASSDIDVTLDNVSGYVFALGLSEYCNDGATSISSVHKIQANPDKSKHLETAVISICGVSIDFAHLRSEMYADTRIPTILPGTPLDDAMRRDLTINALFYNLNTREVEDFTGHGVGDLRDRIIRTPIDPKITLYEDPLRILRIFRFKAKLGFSIDGAIYDALKQPSISEALRTKVSYERIESELSKMLGYENGDVGMLEIIASGYVEPIFKPSISPTPGCPAVNFYASCRAAMCRLSSELAYSGMDAKNVAHLLECNIDRSILLLYMVLHGFTGKVIKTSRRSDYANVVIMRDSLKSSRCRIRHVQRVEECLFYLRGHACGMAAMVKLVFTCRELLFEALLLAAVIYSNSKFLDLLKEVIINKYYLWCEVKPLVDGNDLCALNIPAGQFKDALMFSRVCQFAENTNDKEDILKKVESRFMPDRHGGYCKSK